MRRGYWYSVASLLGLVVGGITLSRPTAARHILPCSPEFAARPQAQLVANLPRPLNVERMRQLINHQYSVGTIPHNLSGTAAMWILVDRRGKVDRATLARSSGNTVIDSVAASIARAFAFSVPEYRGERVCFWQRVPIRVSADGPS